MKIEKVKLKDGKTVAITGSKSISNRLLILGKLFGDLKIENLSNSQDTQLLEKALAENSEVVDIHHAGTAMRFLTSLFAIKDYCHASDSDRWVVLRDQTYLHQQLIY